MVAPAHATALVGCLPAAGLLARPLVGKSIDQAAEAPYDQGLCALSVIK
ncbi:hypothetical protein HZ994_01755 [Akkermansiaceae bacterium]|nr:hypothetical protein HZ994_01755 [Akkermansiaceae bacterium]